MVRIAILALGLCLTIFPAGCLIASEPEDTQDVEQAPEKQAINRTSERLLPDCKVLHGAPNTVINLREVFKGTSVDTGEPLELSVVHNTKSKIADTSFDGEQLILEWKKEGSTEITVRALNPVTQVMVDARFTGTVWQPDYLSLGLTVVGGLGIFLLGMKNMSEGLQAIAGSGLRRMISKVTDNRLMAVGVGTLVTMLVQSSSITTVMVVGFVNSGFMNLAQAIGVIMGANIGTTITGWILALKIGVYGLPMLGLGAFGYLFPRRESVRFAALAIMGLGMVFFGLELMKDGFAMVKDLPDFEAWFARFDAHSYLGVLKCAAVGCILTFIVQSSSATLGITISLATIGVIPFETAAALVLGENIGTTITAWLASFGATTNARRAAYFHVLFNLIGVAWITAIFPWYIEMIDGMFNLPFIRSLAGVEGKVGEAIDMTVRIAAVHTCFNLVNTIVFFPFAGLLGKLLERIVPQKAHKEKPHLTRLDIRMLDTPVMGIEQSRVEVLRMADGCKKMMLWLAELSQQNGEPDRRLTQKLFHREEVLDTIQDEIVGFLSDLLAANLPHDVIDEGRRQLRMADEFESISDYIASILKFQIKLNDQGHVMNDKMRQQLKHLHDTVAGYMQMVIDACIQRNSAVITKANTMRGEIKHLVRTLRKEHLQQMTDEKIEPYVNVAFTSALNSYVRVSDHTLNVAESLAGIK
ncbi:Na/Pi cotransporter family protein [Bythopirellula polymerisocia]|uniref:Na+/Pi-cotransporter n=1 Tax=Bythopirellula polymerisocia TaxID=2528003 RepID=A0A5C6CG33_9BACT|nr:Na/Pi cotransporter family protein [Bythopirellula polymerisocia]TWU23600.1 Na+/Pi-cotransporter [Bythopirellula polymerisocia]